MRHVFGVRVGPVAFRIGSAWRAPVEQLRTLYRDYPAHDGVPDFTVRLEAARPWRRFVRPSVHIRGDFVIPDAAPLPLAQGLLAAEMGMNLQMALGQRRFLLLHAAAVERDGRAVIMTGESGAGKSTLAALLQARGWRLMADEFVLVEPATGLVHPFPRPVSLKNAAIDVARAALPDALWGPLMRDTPKGAIRHLVPGAAALAGAETPAEPVLLLFPRYGLPAEQRPVGAGEAFVRLTQASTNYVGLGERGFTALTRLVTDVTRAAIDYPDTDSAAELIEALW
ncbi:HprK-related kinase A [Sphingomonas jeddahensis]|uniref:HPr kinase/phosphorylase n=1 Tax=Sphingomonas jeddahensis TaxID=1915074 RepID=A0A1V2EV87_9SPHN|nr:HprK-related kinase A [Sphingomonas jeddahensis]ONF96385.1 HPr kinase/phosphorylase [Sphingomonas jeddahensis]